MEDIGEANHEDIMRAFFRLRVGDIGKLLKKIGDVTARASRATGRNIVEFLPEANRAIAVSFFFFILAVVLIVMRTYRLRLF